MWGIGSCWLLKWLWRNGDIGWMEQSSRSWFGLITKTLSTSGPPNDSIPDRPGGLCFVINLISPCHIAQVPRMLKWMHCLVCLTLVLPWGSPLISCLHLTWGIEQKVRQANINCHVPDGCPPNRLFVSVPLRSQVIHWAHTSPVSCHPGIRRTLFVVRQRFWWPSMEGEVREYVTACAVCAQHKSSRLPPSGLLQPLPVPHRPWSDISLDFVTGLPPSKFNTTILTVVDRFSKMVHFIPMPKLPSAKGTAEAVLLHVFCIHGFPKYVVSDRGPQFISQFWKAFCSLLCTTVSLSSGYYPQSNGQAEQMNQELETGLRCLVSQNPAPGVIISSG